VENNYVLLASPGQFVLDTTAHTIYYIPRPGEDLSTATVVAASQQTLVNVQGTSDAHVHNLVFSGLGFQYATWLFDDNGVQEVQADYLAVVKSGAVPVAGALPANVACHFCDDVSFTRDTFEHLGGSGLGFDGGGQGDAVIGNVVTDVAGNGIEIGDVSPDALESGDVVDDNYVYDVANQYPGGVGIAATYVAHTHIDHNEVWDTPYTGISLGWGWTSKTPMLDNHVDDNYVHDVMNSWLYDGGGIYVLGGQAQTPVSTMTGNYVERISNAHDIGALYLDGASSNWQVQNNVIGGYAPHWLFIQNATKYTSDKNAVNGNYIGSAVGPINGTPPSDNDVTDNISGLTSWPARAQTVISGAGLEPAYTGIRNGPQQENLAYGTPAVASSAQADHPASGANAGLTTTPWVSAGSGGWWQTDLGASDSLSDVQILFRQDGVDYPEEREGFQVWVSNNGAMANGHTVACSVGGTPLPYESWYDCPVPAGTWRYVAVVKTDSSRFALGQVRVFGHH
jgi:hypothetical protein